MPSTDVLVFCDEHKNSEFLIWMEELKSRNQLAYARCRARILELEQQGHELRRPHSDYLRDGIRELRTHAGRVQYRILYSFLGRNVAILTHAITKEREVPDKEIERAIRCVEQARSRPDRHTLDWE